MICGWCAGSIASANKPHTKGECMNKSLEELMEENLEIAKRIIQALKNDVDQSWEAEELAEYERQVKEREDARKE